MEIESIIVHVVRPVVVVVIVRIAFILETASETASLKVGIV